MPCLAPSLIFFPSVNITPGLGENVSNNVGVANYIWLHKKKFFNLYEFNFFYGIIIKKRIVKT